MDDASDARNSQKKSKEIVPGHGIPDGQTGSSDMAECDEPLYLFVTPPRGRMPVSFYDDGMRGTFAFSSPRFDANDSEDANFGWEPVEDEGAFKLVWNSPVLETDDESQLG